jgi:hypothetical protein
MKAAIYSVLRPIVGFDPVWKVLDMGLRVTRMFDAARGQVVNARGPSAAAHATLDRLCPDGRVQRGLCQGLAFPKDTSFFSTVAPMMLGLYERPLQQTLETLIRTRHYDLIVDVGSADGFYAVGLAMRCPDARVVACDTEPRARQATLAMAQRNGVADRVVVRGFCSDRDLIDIVRAARRALILSDCEGYERLLFPAGAGEALARHDVAIEVHDWIDYGISPHLLQTFRGSHDVEVIRAPDDLECVRTAHRFVPELEHLAWDVRHALVCENRRNIPGEWLIARSRES